jgi:hypothetical protein
MFQRERLMKMDWSKATELLALEIYEMLGPDVPLSHNAPLTLTAPKDVAPLAFSADSPLFSVSRNGQKLADIVFQDGQLQAQPVDGSPSSAPPKPPVPAVMPGVVQGGSGDTYSVTVYPKGTGAAGQTVTVKQLQINSVETIPAGTWALVTKNGGAYTMQVNVWL